MEIELEDYLNKIGHVKHAGHDISQAPLLVGVINLSPESFYEGSVVQNTQGISNRIAEMYQYGVNCVDVGAMSTRPISLYGGEKVSISQELERIRNYLPTIIDLCASYDLPIALDTQYSRTAEEGIKLGVEVINDISGLKTDAKLGQVISDSGVDLVIMATKNAPGDPCGIEDTMNALQSSLELADHFGIERSRIVIDPGFGGWQGRDATCDLELIKYFDTLLSFELPIYIGVSRKSTIKTLNGGELPEERLAGSIVLTNFLIRKGASIIRTHDVKETSLGLKVKQALDNLS